jgi:hypothetical protein
MTADLNKCKTCQVWKDTKGRGSKACLKCNPFREDLQTVKPLDCVPDDVIEQYPDLQAGKIKSILDGVSHLRSEYLVLFCQKYIGRMSRQELEAYWAKPHYIGYTGRQLERIAQEALKSLQKIVKK